ncbi:major facilitator superfamily protein [Artemisia annua]|uniref:Major facilitator superfamily protein n=1 Tax=Artemisia annua TaxID=35608 RepID=A0A2U1Q7J7_ARTAN|nr:major facilitator superfamily protein [Artemisia annua]
MEEMRIKGKNHNKKFQWWCHHNAVHLWVPPIRVLPIRVLPSPIDAFSIWVTTIGGFNNRSCLSFSDQTPVTTVYVFDLFNEQLNLVRTNLMKRAINKRLAHGNSYTGYYFCIRVSNLVAVTVIVYIQDNIGWGWGLGIPSIAMAVSIFWFIFGYPLYQNIYPLGSPFTRSVQVCVAAYGKRKLHMVSDPILLYDNDELDTSISASRKLLHTKQMKKVS